MVLSCVVEVLYNRDMLNAGRPRNKATNTSRTTMKPAAINRNNNNIGKGAAGGGGAMDNNGKCNKPKDPNTAEVVNVKKQMEVFTIAVRY